MRKCHVLGDGYHFTNKYACAHTHLQGTLIYFCSICNVCNMQLIFQPLKKQPLPSRMKFLLRFRCAPTLVWFQSGLKTWLCFQSFGEGEWRISFFLFWILCSFYHICHLLFFVLFLFFNVYTYEQLVLLGVRWHANSINIKK